MDNTGWKQVLQRFNSDAQVPATDLPWRLRGDETETASADPEGLMQTLYARLATPAPRPEGANFVPGEGRYTRPLKNPHQGTLDFLREAFTGEIAQNI